MINKNHFVPYLAFVLLLAACHLPDTKTQPSRQLGNQPGETPLTAEASQASAVTPATGAAPATATAVSTVRPASEAPSPATKTPAPDAPAAATSSPNVGEQPVVVSSDGASLQIISFTASPAEVNPGDTVTLTWRAVGVSAEVAMCKYDMSHPCVPDGYSFAPLEGTHAFTVPEHVRYRAEFVLVVKGNSESDTLRESVSVPVKCPTHWFFEGAPEDDYCPEEKVLTSHGATQSFEHGLMMWVASRDLIYAFIDASGLPKYMNGEDKWESSMPESDPALVSPPGLYQPVRGFGLAWREWTYWGGDVEHPLKDFLGWAQTPETSVEITIQCSVYKWHDQVCYYQDSNGRIVSTGFYGNWAIVEP